MSTSRVLEYFVKKYSKINVNKKDCGLIVLTKKVNLGMMKGVQYRKDDL